jgi:hypothetical protein
MNEDVFVTPAAWRRSILPRRGGLPVTYRPGAGWKETVGGSLARRAEVRGALLHPATFAQIRDAGLAYLDAPSGTIVPATDATGDASAAEQPGRQQGGQPGERPGGRHGWSDEQLGAAPGVAELDAWFDGLLDIGVTPLGAAAVAIVAFDLVQGPAGAVSSAHADGWVAAHGLAFAVRAAVELVELRVGTPHRSDLGMRSVSRFGDRHVGLVTEPDGTTLLLHRLRVAMAAAGDGEHAAAVAALGEAREGALTLRQRATASFLAPGRQDWVAADVELVRRDHHADWPAVLLYAATADPAHFMPLQTAYSGWHLVRSGLRLHTLAEGLGAAGLPVHRSLLTAHAAISVEWVRDVLGLIAAVPTDEAFELLLGLPDQRVAMPFLAEAAERFPRRAVRILAAADRSGAAGTLLRSHLGRHRAVAEAMVADLPAETAGRVAALLAELDAVRAAPVEALPAVLADPPWLGAAKARKPVMVAGLTCTDETVLRWEPGERDAWRRLERAGGGSLSPAEAQRVAWDLRHGGGDPYRQLSFFVAAPEELARPLVAQWRPHHLWDAAAWLRIIVGRFETDAWPVVLDAARREPLEAAPAVLAFAGPEVAVLVAEWHGRLKSLRGLASQWLLRHPQAAARALVPPALGRPGPARRHAEQALLVLAAAGHRDLVDAAARDLGEAASRDLGGATSPERRDAASRERGDAASREHGEAASRERDNAASRKHGEAASQERDNAASRKNGEAASRENGEAASREHGEAASREHGEAASQERGDAASRENGEAASQERGDAASRENGEAASRERGDAAVAGIAQLLDADPLLRLPAKIPAGPGWADPAQLAPVELADGAGALPAGAVRHLLTMLAMSTMAQPYAGLADVRRACTPASLAAFGWTLFEQWQLVGAPAKDGWVLDALGLLGDDGTVRRLAPVIRAWPGESGHGKAVAALDVLAWIGTDVALMHLHGISEKVKFKGLKDRAKEKIAEVAAALRLTPDELADRLVPTFGLADDGTLTIDYGPRAFTVGFDEQLRPFVVDGTGARRKDLPKPGTKDDPVLAAAGLARFAALKKDVRVVAAAQLHRFEQAMVGQRRWTGAQFRRWIVGHPLVWHVARRLVWATFDGERVTGTLRVAEDRTFADAGDETVTLPDDAVLGVAHPLHLTSPHAWAQVFADYAILQPFPQLARATYTLSDAERTATDLTRCGGVKAPATSVLGLERRGWLRTAPEGGGVQSAMERPLPGGGWVIAELDPGIPAGVGAELPDQVFREVWIVGAGGSRWTGDRPHTIGELDAVTVSEIIRELTEVTQ